MGEDVGETSFEQVLQDKQNHRLKDYLSQSQPFDMIPEETSNQGADSLDLGILDDL